MSAYQRNPQRLKSYLLEVLVRRHQAGVRSSPWPPACSYRSHGSIIRIGMIRQLYDRYYHQLQMGVGPACQMRVDDFFLPTAR